MKTNLADIGSSLERETRQRAVCAGAVAGRRGRDAGFRQDRASAGGLFRGGVRWDGRGAGLDSENGRRPDHGVRSASTAPGRDRPAAVFGQGSVRPGRRCRAWARWPSSCGCRWTWPGRSATCRQQVRDYDQLAATKKETRRFYLQLLVLITLFVLFVAVWVALFLARQITGPVTALLEAARAVRGGDLAYRVRVAATDEFATLVRAFNEMTQDLETNRNELERRRRFTEAVLESIPTGVVSLEADGTVRLTNRAFHNIFPLAAQPQHLADLIPAGMQTDLGRLLKSARRTGSASRQVEFVEGRRSRHFAVTVAALSPGLTSGYVLVIEDTTDLLRAQQAEAWHEVARRIAHELKNPLTPIALRLAAHSAADRKEQCHSRGAADRGAVLRDDRREVDSVKTLVDEFAQFAPVPLGAPGSGGSERRGVRCADGFRGAPGRREGAPESGRRLPAVLLDAEQFKRVVVNLVDNAAEAMQDAPYKELAIATALAAPEVVELSIADTGCGITTEDKAKLFMPYFSTKAHGTGLGLAIVSHIVKEHRGTIRVEDNLPVGARFIIELPAFTAAGERARSETVAAPASPA